LIQFNFKSAPFVAHPISGVRRFASRTLQLALARGHKWLQMLESGAVKSMREIANLEGIDNSYISRMVNLTVLAPDIVEAILDDNVPPELTLFDLAVDPPRLWKKQRDRLSQAKC
jgi:hypothetical protein